MISRDDSEGLTSTLEVVTSLLHLVSVSALVYAVEPLIIEVAVAGRKTDSEVSLSAFRHPYNAGILSLMNTNCQ
jgi:hypothetical protein